MSAVRRSKVFYPVREVEEVDGDVSPGSRGLVEEREGGLQGIRCHVLRGRRSGGQAAPGGVTPRGRSDGGR